MASKQFLDELESFLKAIVSEGVKEGLRNIPQPTTSTQSNIEERFLSRKETAALLKISLPTLHEMTISGEIIAHRVGDKRKRVLYKVSDIQAGLQKIKASIQK